MQCCTHCVMEWRSAAQSIGMMISLSLTSHIERERDRERCLLVLVHMHMPCPAFHIKYSAHQSLGVLPSAKRQARGFTCPFPSQSQRARAAVFVGTTMLACLLHYSTISLSLYLSAKKVYPKDFERRERESVWHVWMQHSSRKSAARRLLLQQIAMHAGGNGEAGNAGRDCDGPVRSLTLWEAALN